MTYILLFFCILFSFILIRYNICYLNDSVAAINSIVLPTINIDQYYYFVKTKYKNISFKQCVRSSDTISNKLKTIGMWPECQEIYDIWTLSNRRGVYIDCGANIGSCSFLFAEAGIEVHAFEPLPNNLFPFSLTTFTNSKYKKHITIYPYALGNMNKDVIITIDKNNWGASSFYFNRGNNHEKIHVKKLDDFLKIPHEVAIMKIDVEGGEYDLLQGGYNFIRKHNIEFMYIEVTCDEKNYSIKELLLTIYKLGYKIIKNINCTNRIVSNIIVKKL